MGRVIGYGLAFVFVACLVGQASLGAQASDAAVDAGAQAAGIVTTDLGDISTEMKKGTEASNAEDKRDGL